MPINREGIKKFISKHIVISIHWTLLLVIFCNPSKDWQFYLALVIFGLYIHFMLLVSVVGFWQKDLIIPDSGKLKHIIALINCMGGIIVLLFCGCYYTAFVLLVFFVTLRLHASILHREKKEGENAA